MSLLAQGATRYNLSKAYFMDIKILLPKKSEQSAIAAILSDMDAEIDVLEVKLAKTRAIKLGMMSELLTGRIRLIEEEPDATVTYITEYEETPSMLIAAETLDSEKTSGQSSIKQKGKEEQQEQVEEVEEAQE